MATKRPGIGPSVALVDVLSRLCAEALAVTIEPLSGEPFGAVLVACDRHVLLYEHWSDVLGMPTGELALIDLGEIAAVRVS